MTPAMRRCGIIWLPGHLDSFPAEGRMHRRDSCERISPGPITFPSPTPP